MNMLTCPLSGKNVLVACSEMKAARLADGLTSLGASVVLFPVIQIREITDQLDAAIDKLSGYSWILLTSGYGASILAEHLRRKGLPTVSCPPVCAIGPATADTAARAGLKVDLVPEEFVAEGVVAALTAKHGGQAGLAGLRILMPRARVARDLIPDALEKAGAFVDVIPCYENTLPDMQEAQARALLDPLPDLLLFTSSSAVTNFAALTGEAGRILLRSATAAALGPITAKTLSGLGKPPEIVPAENTIRSLLETIESYYRKRNQESKTEPRA